MTSLLQCNTYILVILENYDNSSREKRNVIIRGQLETFQFSLVAQSCPTLCDPMDCSMPGLLVHHQLPEFTQIHVHWVGDAIQPSHPLSSSYPPAFNLFQHQGLFQWVFSRSFPVSQFFTSGGQSIGVSASASVLPMNIQLLTVLWDHLTDFQEWMLVE